MTDQTHYIECDIEVTIAGPTAKVAAASTAAALRRIADKLERAEYPGGSHEVSDHMGCVIGMLDLEFYDGR